MSLSFREHAAIAIRSIVIRDRSYENADGDTGYQESACSDADAVGGAERLAEACCEAWGHDVPDLDLTGRDPAVLNELVKRCCRRCGLLATAMKKASP